MAFPPEFKNNFREFPSESQHSALG